MCIYESTVERSNTDGQPNLQVRKITRICLIWNQTITVHSYSSYNVSSKKLRYLFTHLQ